MKLNFKKKRNIKQNKGFIILILTTGFAIIPLMFIPIMFLTLIIGIVLIIIGILSYRKTTKRKTHFLLALLIIVGLISVGFFLSNFLTPKTESTQTENGMIYTERFQTIGGKVWYVEPENENEGGFLSNRIRLPSTGYFTYHCGGSDYDFHASIRSSCPLKDDNINMTVWGSNEKSILGETEKIAEYQIEVNLTKDTLWYSFNSSTMEFKMNWRVGGEISDVVENPKNYEYMLIAFEGILADDVFRQFRPTFRVELGSLDNLYDVIISPSGDWEQQEWGELNWNNLFEVVNVAFGNAVALIYVMFFLLIFWICGYLILWVTGNSKISKHYLFVLLMIGLITLLEVTFSAGDNVIFISGLINLLENYHNFVQDWWILGGIKEFLGYVIEVLILVFHILAMIFAGWLWTNTVGVALTWIITTYFLWTHIIQDIRQMANQISENEMSMEWTKNIFSGR
jgi:hypothetical protein